MKPPGRSRMSDHSSDLRALMKRSGNLRDEAQQAREHALEPGEGARNGVGLFDVLPDLVLVNQVHEAADERLGSARYRFAGDGILAHDGDEQRPAGGALGELGDGLEDCVADEFPDVLRSVPLTKLMMRSMGSVKMRLARSQTSPRWKMSRQLRLSRKSMRAFLMELPTMPSVVDLFQRSSRQPCRRRRTCRAPG